MPNGKHNNRANSQRRNTQGQGHQNTALDWNIKQNPYNFVRSSDRIVGKDTNGNPMPLPDHSKFSGNSGCIKCEVANETPLFCGGEITESADRHKTIKFFRLNEKLAIPSTSLKGMLRSFIESLTGSCMSVFDGSRLDFRKPTSWAGQKTFAGMITKLPNSDNEPGEIKVLEVAWVQTYSDDTQRGSNPILPKIDLHNFQNGNKVYVKTSTLVNQYINSRGNSIPTSYYYIKDIRPVSGDIAADEKVGYVKITGQDVMYQKKRERVFFENNPKTITVAFKEKQDYDHILKQQIERKKKGQTFKTQYQNDKLSVGDLIYFQKENNSAVKLSNVAVPRLRYSKGTGDRTGKPEDYTKCGKSNPCIACRMFGFTEESDSLSGRISFSHAFINESPSSTLNTVILRPLGTPNPTSYNLYLESDNNNIVRDYDGYQTDPKGNKRENQNINANVHLRGRKFYWHHRNNDILQRATLNERTKLNSTAEVLVSKNAFKFRVYFNNLTDFELGLLLYSLKLEGNMRHKCGMAKNLGFGTVNIAIKNLFIDNLNKKYANLTENYREDKTSVINDFVIGKFKSEISDFDNRPAVQDLKRILDPTRAPGNIGYEVITNIRDSWYMQNKNVPLPTAQKQ